METVPKPSSALVTLRIAEPADFEALERCRFDVYAEQGYIDARGFPAARERDAYDDHAVSAIATVGPTSVVVGTARLIVAADGPLPIQAAPHAVDVGKLGHAAEISRLCVRREYRHGRAGIGLCRVLFQVAEKRGVEVVYAILDERLLAGLRWIGLPFRAIGPPQAHMGVTVPCLCVIDDVLPALRASPQANLLGVTWLFERACPSRLVL